METLRLWDITDWPHGVHASSLEDYKVYVAQLVELTCLSRWRQVAGTHALPISFLEWRPLPSVDLCKEQARSLKWSTLLWQRSLCRLRCGLLRFGHVGGERSSARRQACLFCGTFSLSLHFHVLCRCPCWDEQRHIIWMIIGDSIPGSMESQLSGLFSLSPASESYHHFVSWAAQLDKRVCDFWGGEHGAA